MSSLPASRLERICMVLMQRIGTRELIIESPEVLDLESKYFLSHEYDKFTNRLIIQLRGLPDENVN